MAGTAPQPPARGRLQRLIVTRPQPEADQWALALQAQGWPAEAWPLLHIGEPTDSVVRQRLADARRHWHANDALMFVSAAAVRHFFAAPLGRPPVTCTTRFWAPGPGTARALAEALQAQGLRADRIDAPPAEASQFDSEHLWPVVAGQMGARKRLLIVRGEVQGEVQGEALAEDEPVADPALAGQGRDWLIEQCRERGADVQALVAYQRRVLVLSADDAQRLPQRCGSGSVWLFSSSQAVQALASHWPQGARAVAMVTHPRIAQAAQAVGFSEVVVCRPALSDVVRGLESWALRP